MQPTPSQHTADTTQESAMPSPFLARRGPVTPTCETCGEARDDLETTEGYTECADCAGANGDPAVECVITEHDHTRSDSTAAETTAALSTVEVLP